MPGNYTGDPGGTFDVSDIPLPADDDDPSGALFSAPLETILDNLAILNARAGVIESDIAANRQAFAYMAEIQGTSVASGDYLDINASDVNEGFSTFSALGGIVLQFPTFTNVNDRGIYVVTIDAYAQVSGTDDPALGQIVAELYDASGPSSTVLAQIVGRRFNATAGDAFAFHGTFLVDMTGLAPGNSRLALQNLSGTAITMQAAQSRISVARIGRGSP